MQSFLVNSGVRGLWKLLKQGKIAVAAVLYFAIGIIILNRYGINTDGEAVKYIDDANRILNGEHLRNGFFSIFYVAYSFLVSVFIYFSISLYGIACIQILLSFIAACSIYKIVLNETGNSRISFISFLGYLVCFPIQKWNFFLYTESLHTSICVAGLYFLYCIFQKGQTSRLGMFLFILPLVIFLRPVGIIFFISTVIVWIVWLIKHKKKIIYYPVIAALLICLLFFSQSKFVFYFNPDSLRRMEIICQVPQVNTSAYKEYNASGLDAFGNVIVNEIGVGKFLSLGFKKLGSFFSMTRNFYSPAHNFILLLTGILLYPLAIIGLIAFRNGKLSYLKIFSACYILITATGIFFTCDEWSNRFIAPVLPLVLILSAMGLHFIFSLILKTRTQNKNN